MSSLDTNIVLIALPTIARQLPGTSLLDLIWILIGYQLITAAILVSFGRLADMFGRVKLYNLGFIIFTAGSALCSISFTSLELILFRMIQGVGAAFLFSNSAAIITDAFPISERGKALGINQVVIVFGAAVMSWYPIRIHMRSRSDVPGSCLEMVGRAIRTMFVSRDDIRTPSVVLLNTVHLYCI